MIKTTIIALLHLLILDTTTSSYPGYEPTALSPFHPSKWATTTTEPGSGSLVTPSSSTEEGVSFFKLYSNSGALCILMKTDAVVEVNFLLHTFQEQADTFIPDNSIVDGTCGEDKSSMSISWSGYILLLKFAKLPGGERWYIEQVKLTVSPDLPKFKGIKTDGKLIKLYNNTVLIPTPVGRSYHCQELDIDLLPDDDDHPPPGLKGSVLLRLLQLQPFMYKSNNFGPPYECKKMVSTRDETAPIAVGSTLAIAVLMTVAGYAVFRYFKVKNVQYNTME